MRLGLLIIPLQFVLVGRGRIIPGDRLGNNIVAHGGPEDAESRRGVGLHIPLPGGGANRLAGVHEQLGRTRAPNAGNGQPLIAGLDDDLVLAQRLQVLVQRLADGFGKRPHGARMSPHVAPRSHRPAQLKTAAGSCPAAVFIPALCSSHRRLEVRLGDVPVRVMPDRLAVLDQNGLRAGVLRPYLLGESERQRALLNDPDPRKPYLTRLGRVQKLRPLTVGVGRDRSGGGMLEDQDSLAGGLRQHGVEVGHRHNLPRSGHDCETSPMVITSS